MRLALRTEGVDLGYEVGYAHNYIYISNHRNLMILVRSSPSSLVQTMNTVVNFTGDVVLCDASNPGERERRAED